MTIKEKLSLIKQLSGKTQEKLAAELNVSFPTLNSWINGKTQPRKAAEQRINELFLHLTGQNVIPAKVIEGKKAGILQKILFRPFHYYQNQSCRYVYQLFLWLNKDLALNRLD